MRTRRLPGHGSETPGSAQLHGVLARIRDLGVPLLSLTTDRTGRLIVLWMRCGGVRGVERVRWAGSRTACRPLWPGLRTMCRPAGPCRGVARKRCDR